MFAIFRSASDEEKQAKAQEWVAAVKKEIEPLLENANPFFNGSKELTLAEVRCPPPVYAVLADKMVR